MHSAAGDEFHGTERFQVIRRLQTGGAGVVYEAYDRERDLRVALKTLRHMDADALYRFKQEFRSSAEIVHPNLVPLYELISDGERWFFTMELIDDGIDLLSYVRGRTATDLASQESETSPPNNLGEQPTSSSPTLDLRPAQPPAATMANNPFIIARETPNHHHSPHNGASVGRETGQEGIASSVPGPTGPETTIGPSQSVVASNPAERRLPSAELDFPRLRSVFRQLAEGVRALHLVGKLHRDLKPGNVLVRANGQVILLDFGLVAEFHAAASASQAPVPEEEWATQPSGIAGTAAYMAPEQAAAQRLSPASDWYAVGVMLFQALTDRLPFRGAWLEMLQAKQVHEAPTASDLAAGIPDDLNVLCVDLLRRDPAARPSGAEVLARLGGGPLPADADAAAVAQSPLFVGRQQHLTELMQAFQHARQGKTVLYHVQGKSGAGKSTLVQHFLEGLTARGEAVILSGRCHEQESMPYKAVDSLVDALTRYLLRLGRSEVEALLPTEAAALARIFPVLTRVDSFAAAARTAADITDLREPRRQAFAAFRDLLTRLARHRPLVLFVDDLHWGDFDGTALLANLLRPPDAPPLLMLIAYRSEYVGHSPCLQLLDLAFDGEQSLQGRTMVVEALTVEETRQLAVALLGGDSAETRSRAEWVVRESGGSAFFIGELVRYLRAGLAPASTEGLNLDEVLWGRVLRLPSEARRLLEVIAAADRPIRLRLAQEAAHLPALPPQLVALLRSAHLVRSSGPHLDDDIETFHDRVRESVLAHLAPATRRAYHAGLAETMEAAGDDDPERLATHFEAAGQPAKASRYYTQAARKALHVLAYERAETLYQKATVLAPSDLDKIDVYDRMIHFYTDMARFADAYAVGRRSAALLGFRLPARFRPLHFLRDYLESKLRLWGRDVAALLERPTTNDPRVEAAVRLLSAVAKAAYQVQPGLNVVVSTKGINLCLKHGNSRDCAVCYLAYGVIFQGGVLGKHRLGYDFGRLALNLVEKYGNAAQRAEVHFVVGYFATSWMRPTTEAEELWRIAYHAAGAAQRGDAADLFNIGCSSAATIMSYHMRGVPMDEVVRASDRYLEFLRRANLREPIGVLAAVRQFIRNLRGQTPQRASFHDAEFDEDAYVRGLASFGSRHFAHFYYILKMQALYLWGEYDKALEMARLSANYLKESPGMLHSAEHTFYHALVLAALLPQSPVWRRCAYLRQLRRAQRMFQQWARQCADNFQHKERLLAAEILQARGKHAEALRAYEEARAAAEKYGYLQVEALASQRAACLHRSRNSSSATASCLAAACASYRRWGAAAYADALMDGSGV